MLLSSKNVGKCVKFQSDAWVQPARRAGGGWASVVQPGERVGFPRKLSQLRWPEVDRPGSRPRRYGLVVGVHEREYVVQALDGQGPLEQYALVEARKLDLSSFCPGAA